MISEITFVPTFDLEEFTCEAYNEAVNLPVKQTVQVDSIDNRHNSTFEVT